MLPKNSRLRKTKDIENVQRKGNSFFTKYFVFKFTPNNTDKNRFTVIISNKISKNATTRNRVKRILRDEIRKQSKCMKGGYDVILNVTRGVINEKGLIIDNKVIRDSVKFAIVKSKLCL